MPTRQAVWPLIRHSGSEPLQTHSTGWNGVHTVANLIRNNQELAKPGAVQVFAGINDHKVRGTHVKVRGPPSRRYGCARKTISEKLDRSELGERVLIDCLNVLFKLAVSMRKNSG